MEMSDNKAKVFERWDLETKEVRSGYDYEDVPIFTTDNFLQLLDHHIDLVEKFNDLVDRMEREDE
jgi:hypothetical protein